jgi:DNA-binding protein HU-beta
MAGPLADPQNESRAPLESREKGSAWGKSTNFATRSVCETKNKNAVFSKGYFGDSQESGDFTRLSLCPGSAEGDNRAFSCRRLPTINRKGGGMNKNEFIDRVAEMAGVNKAEATRAVDAVFDAITEALRKGDDVRLVGFGSFSAAKRKAREGRNPRTGETIHIPESIQPKFSAGKGLKDALNQ